MHFSESLHLSTFHCIFLHFSEFFYIYQHFSAFLYTSLHFSAFLWISLNISIFLCISMNLLHFSGLSWWMKCHFWYLWTFCISKIGRLKHFVFVFVCVFFYLSFCLSLNNLYQNGYFFYILCINDNVEKCHAPIEAKSGRRTTFRMPVARPLSSLV